MQEKNYIAEYLRAIYEPGDVREVRIIPNGSSGFKESGYFDNIEAIEKAIKGKDRNCNVYITLNPTDESLIARSENRLKRAGKGESTPDKYIKELRFVLIDVDIPGKPSGISSNKKELEWAHGKAKEIIADLGDPHIFACSGNGFHIIYKHNRTENSPENKEAIKLFLQKLDEKYGCIDKTTYNPSRITKIIGTYARKGDSTKKRPHRQSSVISINKESKILDIPLPEKKTEKPAPQNTIVCRGTEYQTSEQIVADFFKAQGIQYDTKEHEVGTIYNFDRPCFFDSSHEARENSVIIQNDGKIIYQCHHNSCKGKTWNDVKSVCQYQATKPCKFCGDQIFWDDQSRKFCNSDKTVHKCKKRPPKKEGGSSPATPPRKLKQYDWLTDRGAVITGIATDVIYEERLKGKFLYSQESFWMYENGVWEPIPEEWLESEIREFLTSVYAKQKTIRDIFYQLKLIAFPKIRNFEFNPNKHLLCLRDCVLDTSTMKTLPHCPDFYHNIQLNVSWRPDAESEAWVKYINSLGFTKQTIDRLQEWMGYCFSPYTKHQRSLYLKGRGGDGKSIFINTLSAIAAKACSAIEPSDFSDKFSLAELSGKLINLCSDISTKDCMGNMWKNVVAGDEFTASFKYKKPFKFKPIAKHVFSANDFVPTKDKSKGFYRRFDMIEFTRSFTEDDEYIIHRDYDLQDKINEQLDGVFVWAMGGLQRLLENNWNFTESQEMQATLEEFKLYSNPIEQFIDDLKEDGYFDSCEMNTSETKTKTFAYTHSEFFYEKYKDWSDKNGYEKQSSGKFTMSMKNLGFEKVRCIEEIQGKKYRPRVFKIPNKMLSPDSLAAVDVWDQKKELGKFHQEGFEYDDQV